MAGFDDDNFSLSGLMQEGHDFVTVINSSSSDNENYDGLLECAHQLAGETSDKSSMEGGMQPGVEPGIEPGVSNIPIVDYFFQMTWHLLYHNQSSPMM